MTVFRTWSSQSQSQSQTQLLLMLLLLLLCHHRHQVVAILPTAAIQVTTAQGETFQLLASQASFGSYPPQKESSERSSKTATTAHPLVAAPTDNTHLCDNSTTTRIAGGGLVMVPRGFCTFEFKALVAQRLGAAGIIVYGTLDSRYTTANGTTLVYPQNKMDYDCHYGSAYVEASAFQLEHGVYAPSNDALLSGDGPSTNLCLAHSSNQLNTCPSKACLLTGNTTSTSTSTSTSNADPHNHKLQLCCAWDLHVWLYKDPTITENITIPAVYVTMKQYQQLKTGTTAVLYARWRPHYNVSSFLVWALGVCVAATAAWSSASEYRTATKQQQQQQTNGSIAATASSGGGMEPSRVAPSTQHHYHQQQEEQLELSAGHALGFIVMASSGLFILFFFKIYKVVKIMYAFGCSRALMQVIFEPLWHRLIKHKNRVVCATGTADFGDITLVDVLSFGSGYTWGMIWLVVAFTVRHPEQYSFFWVTQDIMGACMCIMFLSIIKLNSIRVASILLLVAFFYDIFFVFVTPLLFQESIMITVATSGGPPKGDPSWCEKYPDDHDCQGGDPLPMLLTIPRFLDYQGGASLLGLGDIVLPGLLLSFAARLDAAKALLGGGRAAKSGFWSCCCHGTYFGPLVVAYALGLMMANVAVYVMNMGQPALLYLVPCCLGTMCVLGWRRGELTALWHGPKVVTTADHILYGGVPTDEGLGDAAPMAPSAEDEQP